MCDTLVALPNATRDGVSLFAKNSDREPDETQNIEVIPAADHASSERVKCTEISINQVPHTHAVLLSRPFWMFGAEMGANEHGVAIGNEALFTRVKTEKTGLLGMDILRLALERGATAAEARDVIISLIETHGQGGRHGYRHRLDYMNGFLIADPCEAFVLETAGRDWAWKAVKDVWSISNIISITTDFDACSQGLVQKALQKGWAKSKSSFNFREAYSDRFFTYFSMSRSRECRSRMLLQAQVGRLTTRDFMEILRDHGEDPKWRPGRQRQGTVCMHAANPLTRPTGATGSLVARLKPGKNDFYVTGAANPCLSPFFPVSVASGAPPEEYRPGGADYDPESYWWMSEAINRVALLRFHKSQRLGRSRLAALEDAMTGEIESLPGETPAEIAGRYFALARDFKEEFGEDVRALQKGKAGWLLKYFIARLNERNGIPPEVSPEAEALEEF